MIKWTPALQRRRLSLKKPSRRQLQLLLLGFLLCVAVPLGVLFHRVYGQLRQEALYQYRLSAEHVMRLVADEMLSRLSPEENRPFADYGFFRVEEQKLLRTKGLALSPLSQFPVSADFPGLIGYFQIHPDGTFSSPVLPDITPEQFQAYNIQFGEAEYSQRLALRKQLEAVLHANRLVSFAPTTKRKVSEREPHDGRERPPDRRSSAVLTAPAVGRQQSEVSANEADREQPQAEIILRSTFQGQKLDDLNLAQPLSRKQPTDSKTLKIQSHEAMGSKSELPFKKKRTERIDIPANQSVGAYRQYLDSRIEKPKEQFDLLSDDTMSLLVSFEGEIDPIQLYILQDLTFAFVRKAWKARQRYIQGFFVNGRTFLRTVIQPRFHNSSIGPVSRLVVSYRGEVLEHIEPAPTPYGQTSMESRTLRPQDGKPDTVIYQTRLVTPFDDITVHVTMPSLPLGPSATVVHVLVVLLPAVLLAGVLGIYRLAAQQIKLAEARQDFVSAVSHELKTPLTSIRMYGEMLRAGWVQDEAKRQTYYDFIFFESERLSRLVANVLHLARLTNTNSPLDLTPYHPTTLLDHVCATVHSQVQAAGFTLEVVDHLSPTADRSMSIDVEEDAFTQIVINLVDNALKFSAQADPKVVRLELCATEGPRPSVIFAVRDYGPGVAQDQMQRIFQLFYRVGSELTRTTPGTGIGLALVKELGHKMHAQVDLRNRQPGAEFLVTFRAVRAGLVD